MNSLFIVPGWLFLRSTFIVGSSLCVGVLEVGGGLVGPDETEEVRSGAGRDDVVGDVAGDVAGDVVEAAACCSPAESSGVGSNRDGAWLTKGEVFVACGVGTAGMDCLCCCFEVLADVDAGAWALVCWLTLTLERDCARG